MIQKDTNIPKIIDFGLACRSPCDMDAGTKEYIAPESTAGLKTPASDMWALGVALYTGSQKKFPFAGSDAKVVFGQILNDPAPRLNTPNTLLNDIVNGLLVKDPNKRLTADQVIELIDSRLVGPPPSPTPATLGYSPRTPVIPPARLSTKYLNEPMELTPMRPLSASSGTLSSQSGNTTQSDRFVRLASSYLNL